MAPVMSSMYSLIRPVALGFIFFGGWGRAYIKRMVPFASTHGDGFEVSSSQVPSWHYELSESHARQHTFHSCRVRPREDTDGVAPVRAP